MSFQSGPLNLSHILVIKLNQNLKNQQSTNHNKIRMGTISFQIGRYFRETYLSGVDTWVVLDVFGHKKHFQCPL